MKPVMRERKRALFRSDNVRSEIPSIQTSPEKLPSSPARQLRSVVLPQPDGPMMATKPPRSTCTSISLSASTVTEPVR